MYQHQKQTVNAFEITIGINKGYGHNNESTVNFKGTIYQFTLNTIYSAYENIKKASSKRKSSFLCLFQKFILK